MSADSTPFAISVVDPADEAMLARQLAFEARVGSPRHRTVAERQAALSGIEQAHLLRAEDAAGNIVASFAAVVHPSIGVDVLQLNGFAASEHADAFSALLADTCRWGSELGATSLLAHVIAPAPHELALWTDEGFSLVGERSRVALEVTSQHAGLTYELPTGVDIVPLRTRPDLEAAAWDVVREALIDVPSPMQFAPDSSTNLRDDIAWAPDEPLPETMIAAVTASDEVVGVGYLVTRGQPDGVAAHRMTGVARAWRQRGIARALKVHLIRWAAEHGFVQLVASNDEHNVAIKRLNESLGYEQIFSIALMARDLDC